MITVLETMTFKNNVEKFLHISYRGKFVLNRRVVEEGISDEILEID